MCSVPVLVVAQRRERLDVSRRFMRGSIAIGLVAGTATLFVDDVGSGFVVAVLLVVLLYVATVLVAAVTLSRE